MAGLSQKLDRMQELEEEAKRVPDLEEEVQELRQAEEDNHRLRESNDALRKELDKRDQAVTEAVDLICQLEAKVKELETGHTSTQSARPPTSEGSEVETPKIGTFINIPERTSSRGVTTMGRKGPKSEPRHLQRAPSFLQERSKSTAALRGLFAPAPVEKTSTSAVSAIAKTESSSSMNEGSDAQSPRISALSECSELSPFGSPTKASGFDQLESPADKESNPGSVRSARLDQEEQEWKNESISRWMEPQTDVSPVALSKRRKRATINGLGKGDSSSPEDELRLPGAFPRSRSEAVFGGMKLPPTPDTMCTYAAGPNRSNGSVNAKGPSAEASPKQHVGRPRSAEELVTRRGSNFSAFTDSMDANLDATPSLDRKDEAPAIFPLHGLPSNNSRVFSPHPANIPSFGYYGGASTLEDGKGTTSKATKSDLAKSKTSQQQSSDNPPSPTLAPYDWLEAAQRGPRSRKETTRTPSQSSFLARRYSLDSNRETENFVVPTLDPSSLEPSPQNTQDSGSRRRISLRFFNRSNDSRRLQPSPMFDDLNDDGDGAPSPVVSKTRQTGLRQPKATPTPEPVTPSQKEARVPTPTYADKRGDYMHKTLPNSFTESNMPDAARPSTANSNRHKRRSSLGIINWMKGASGIGSLRKSDHSSPNNAQQTNNDTARERPPSRLNSEASTVPSELSPRKGGEEWTPKAKHTPRSDDQEPGRRPRYLDRRSRRG